MLHKAGRCHICLKKHHLSRDCPSGNPCAKYRGHHHISIYPRIDSICERNSSSLMRDLTQKPWTDPTVNYSSRNTPNLYMNVKTSVLLQTTKVWLHNLSDNRGGFHVAVRSVMDSGSQRRTYRTSRTRRALNLSSSRSEHLCIKTFGTASKMDSDCEVVRFGLRQLMESYWRWQH